MVLAKSKNTVGLGNSLMNDRFGKGKGSDRKKGSASVHRVGQDGQAYVTNAPKEASWVKMRSVTEQGALDEFLSTAELAGTDFTAEKTNNIKIIQTNQKNPYLLSAVEEQSTLQKHKAHFDRLTVPRRPKWDDKTTPQELNRMEKESLLEWRRGLAELQESNDLLMTPFERNLEVWRQLWRVIERSDLVVQIVDARNPLLFRSEDLERYVKEVDPRKENLLLVNKADMMSVEQRAVWADYFENVGIKYTFFSAALAKEMNEALESQISFENETSPESQSNFIEEVSENTDEKRISQKATDHREESSDSEDGAANKNFKEGEETETQHARTRIMTVDELEELFIMHAPKPTESVKEHQEKIQIGLVGYPNVGKSSTINALIGAKKVSVSSTPGKTKHFQTIHLSPAVILCDCPGLVFPNFSSTKAELVCNGILPIDQLREFTGPVGLVTQRIPQKFLEALYGIKIHIRPAEEGGTGVPSAEELLVAYAKARGFTKTGLGQPDESRAARYILKDYVKGKLLFCHPPPLETPIDSLYFNRELYDEDHLPEKRRAALLGPSLEVLDDEAEQTIDKLPQQGEKGKRLDKKFFGSGPGNQAHLSTPFSHKYSDQGIAMGEHLSGRKQRSLNSLEKDIDPTDLRMLTSKKHFKGGKRMAKTRGEIEY
ncbi:MAG: hypothetical protein M1829_001760 [Trizodia sp. TS-e1964]|nr:MAG: hypothetical protein M1829_001760 [Trizodia sp. TS-e1964]